MLLQSDTKTRSEARQADRPLDVQPSPELIAFVKRQIRDGQPTEYRRAEQRYSCLTQVAAQAVDENDDPVGEPFAMVSRDISRSASAWSAPHASPATGCLCE